MKKHLLRCSIAFCVITLLLSFDLPSGWIRDGGNPDKFEMGIDKGAGQDGKDAATIKSTKKTGNEMGTLMQECKADQYLGKRIRMSGYIKSKDVKTWASFWFRVDGDCKKKVLAFDNMMGRPIKGTTNWTKYEIVLDVPDNAVDLAYGGMLIGSGQIWFDNIKFEVVDSSVKSTNTYKGEEEDAYDPLPVPTNLDFGK